MAARHRFDRRIRRSDITAYRTFSDNFVLTPNKSFFTDVHLPRLSNVHSKTCPLLKVEKPPVKRWEFDSFPNLRGIPRNAHARNKSRSKTLVSREDTFDADFMMPSQVREILEEEGLENNVITGVIGSAEERHKKNVLKLKVGPRRNDDKQKEYTVLPQIGTTSKPVLKYNGMGSSSWLDLARQQPRDQLNPDIWETPHVVKGRDEYLSWNYGRDIRTFVEDIQMELDRKKWVAAQHVEHLYSGDNFRPPRIVLVSSKIPKCHLLTQVYNDSVIPILYDFDSCTFTEILDAIAKKLDVYRKNCKAKSVMVLCQGGPGYIYLLRNFAITPQKLYKPSYRSVVGFWRALADMISKLNPEESAIHLVGFNLTENDQGKKLLPMLQSLMYPNLVRLDVPNEDTDAGRSVIGQYFKYGRYQVWKAQEKSSFTDINFIQEETGPIKRHFRAPVLRVER